MNMACFDSRSMTTSMAVKPDEDRSCLMKSIEMEFHGQSVGIECLCTLVVLMDTFFSDYFSSFLSWFIT